MSMDRERIIQAQTMIVGELDEWLANGIILQKAEGSAWARLVEDCFIHLLAGENMTVEAQKPQLFIVQHDWASAFTNAQDFEGGDFQVPFPCTCFEFRISGKRVCATVHERDGQKCISAIVELSRSWVMPITMFFLTDGEWKSEIPQNPFDQRYGDLVPFLAAQIKAICVSLEAEVAAVNLVEAPPKLNAARARRGKGPLPNYHVLYLNRGLRSVGVEGQPSKKRLHFRRGHWRHLSAERRIWVRWCLVGNPDLGFIDKEYRL